MNDPLDAYPIGLSVPADVVATILAMPSLDEAPDDPSRKYGQGGNPWYYNWMGRQSCFGCKVREVLAGGLRAQHALRRRQPPVVRISEVHHILNEGTSLKCPDEWTIPLCHDCHHAAVHSTSAQSFLEERGLWGPLELGIYEVAARLYLAEWLYTTDTAGRYEQRAVFYFRELEDRLARMLGTDNAST